MKDYRTVRKGDYIYAVIPNHPNATANGYVLEHRYIVEQSLGRLLSPNEIVHHKDGNKKNNVLSNLEITTQEKHGFHHNKDKGRKWCKLKCPWCGKIFDKPYNQTFLQKGTKYTCCSTTCRGKLSSIIQYKGLNKILEAAISENLVSIYFKYLDDNSEATDTAGAVETIRS